MRRRCRWSSSSWSTCSPGCPGRSSGRSEGMARHRATTIDPAHYHSSQVPFFLVLLPLAAFMLLPIIFIFFHALKPLGELFAYPPRFLARRPTLDNFLELLETSSDFGVPVSRYFFN